MRQLDLPASETRYERFDLNGGLDLLTPTLKLPPGKLRDVLNFEQAVTGGYARIDGYERHDGRPNPSDALYQVLTYALTGAVVVGNAINGQTSGATAVVIGIEGTLLILSKNVGAFAAGENLRIGVTVFGTVVAVGGSGVGDDWDAIQLNKAADLYRADIQAVPGSGPIRGVHRFAGVTYAWRDNVGSTALAIYKSTAGGWVAITLGSELTFSTGTAEYPVGATLTKGGTTAVIRGVLLESGSWAAGTAAGHLVVTGIAGGPFTAGVATGGGGSATLAGAESAIVLGPGGRVEVDVGFFALGGGGTRMYVADGVNRAYEFDGTYVIPIHTGVTPDTPKHPRCHKDHLFLAFGGVLKNSGITTPYNWSVIAGGGEYRCASTINALLRQPGAQSTGAMSISTDDSTEMLYGTDATDFQKVTFEQSAGGKAYSAQSMGGQAFAFGDIGVMAIAATQAFGNFATSSLTLPIRPFTQDRRNRCTASVVARDKSQYRVFFSDGSGLYMTLVNGKLIGSMLVQFPNLVTCACSGETPDTGNETMFFGADNGFVYRLDAGTSFDGEDIAASCTLVFTNEGNSRVIKRYRGAALEVQGAFFAQIQASFEVGYSDGERQGGPLSQPQSLGFDPGTWDDGGSWDDGGQWDGRELGPLSIELAGSGVNVALRLECSSDLFRAFTINSIILHYSVRKALKK